MGATGSTRFQPTKTPSAPKELVRQVMRKEGLGPCQLRSFKATSLADVEAAAAMPDLVKRNFTADRLGIKFVGNITFVHTRPGFIILTTAIHCYSRKVVG